MAFFCRAPRRPPPSVSRVPPGAGRARPLLPERPNVRQGAGAPEDATRCRDEPVRRVLVVARLSPHSRAIWAAHSGPRGARLGSRRRQPENREKPARTRSGGGAVRKLGLQGVWCAGGGGTRVFSLAKVPGALDGRCLESTGNRSQLGGLRLLSLDWPHGLAGEAPEQLPHIKTAADDRRRDERRDQ